MTLGQGDINLSSSANLRSSFPLVIFTVTQVALLLLSLTLTQFSHALADDLFRFSQGQKLGVLGGIAAQYTHWSGRWAGTWLEFLPGAVFEMPLGWYRYLMLSDHILLFLGIAATLKAFYFRLSVMHLTLGTATFYNVIWSSHPNLGETFFWATGYHENLLPPVLFALSMGLLKYALEYDGKHRIFWTVFASAVGFYTSSTHEIIGTALVCASLCQCFAAKSHQCLAGFSWRLKALMLGPAAGFVTVLAAPGNYVRAARMEEFGHPMSAIQGVLESLNEVILPQLTSLPVATLTLMVLLVASRQGAASKYKSTLGNLGIWHFAPPFAALLLACWANGTSTPSRTTGMVSLLFMFAWIRFLFELSAADWTVLPGSRPRNHRRLAALAALLLASLFVASNVRGAWEDVLYRVKDYDVAMLTRETTLAEAQLKGAGEVLLPPIRNWPHSFPKLEAGSEEPNLINRQLQEYYRISHIRIDNPPM